MGGRNKFWKNESDDHYIPSVSESNINEEEEKENEEDGPNTIPDRNSVCGKNRYKWSEISPVSKNTRTLQHNMFTVPIVCKYEII